jgi:two-component system, cell cycle sensor histidine kinase and response regulator CckA
VSDNGSGMTPEVIDRAFEPFYTTKPVGKGTGLGLASVYGTVKQAGGEVTIRSVVGEGTCITMLLESVDPCPEAMAMSKPRSERGRGTVLLVEDQDGVRSFSSRVLKGAGYHVLEAENAMDALRIAADHRGDIDLIFSDVVMPGFSIVDAIERIRVSRPSIAVLMTSGYPDMEVRKRLGALEVELLRKPYPVAELLDHVARSIRRRGARLRPVA